LKDRADIRQGLSSRGIDSVIYLMLVVSSVLVFGQVADFGFVNFDDPRYFEHNRFVRMGLTWESIAWAFTDGIATTGYWAPLTLLSLLVDSQVYGMNPGGYHVTNLLLHIANTLLLYVFFRRTTGSPWPSALVAMLFAIHPLHVESVAWITERKDVLSTLFWILTMLAYVRYTAKPRMDRYLAVMIFFVAGIMAKPMLVTLPFVLLLLDYWPLGRLSGKRADGQEVPSSGPVKIVVEKIPLLIIALAAGLVAYIFQQEMGAVAPLADISLGIRIANTLVAYAGYIQDMLWPVDLAVLYPHPGPLPLWMPLISAFFLVGITALVLWKAAAGPFLLTGWMWYLLTLAPVSGLVVIGPHATADRYTYVPLIGVFIMIAWQATAIAEQGTGVKTGLAVVAIMALAALGVQARFQTKVWENSVTLFEHALSVTEVSEHAYLNLGSAYSDQGRLEKALLQYQKALLANPASARAYMNIGTILLRKGKTVEAIRSFDIALEIDPATPRMHNNIGNAYLQLNDPRQAAYYFREGLQHQPFDAKAHNGLGVALLLQGQVAEAQHHFEKALSIYPGYPSAKYNLNKLVGKPTAFEKLPDGES